MIGRHAAIFVALVGMATSSEVRSQPIITLEGIVRDDAGGIPRAAVSAIDSLTNERRTASTDSRGFFRMLDLGSGHYVVTARAIGRSPLTQFVHLGVGQRAQLDFMLERSATVLQTVEVKEQAVQTEIQRMSVSTAVTAHEIQNLPLNARNVMELAAVAPGIRSFRPVAGRSLPAAGALRDERAINLYLDGVEMKNLNTGNVVGSPQTGSPLPADALQEFRVFLNTYDAEYTRGAAYVMSAVTHRGTNQRHGSAFGFFQNRDLVGVTDFQRQIPNFEKPDFRRVQAGFSLRGPFVRDRLFYALSYELSDTDNLITVVPGRPAHDPGYWDRYAGVFNAPNRNHTGLLRLTWAHSDGNLFDAISSLRHMTGESLFGGTVAREAAVRQEYVVSTVKLRHRWLPTPRLANELSLQFVGWSHEDRPLAPGPEFRYPTLTIGRAGYLDIDETQLRLADRVTYSTGNGPGSHLLKAGVEVGRVTAVQFSPQNGSGVFSFRSETAEPYEALLAVGFFHPETVEDARTSLDGLVAGAYVNDEWQLSSRLTLNLGVRYDAEFNTLGNDFTVTWVNDTALNSKPELEGLLNKGNRKNDLNNVSPRLSLSWDVTGTRRTFLRGGFGIMYDRVPGLMAFAEQRASDWRTYVFVNPGTVDPQELRARVVAGGVTATSPQVVLIPNRMESPENRQWSLGVGTHLTRALALNVDYIDQKVRKVSAPVNLNWVDRSQTSARRVLSLAHGNIIAHGDFSRAEYRALLTS
ncbi:MAG: TonB-dependent receptor, partial [Gemmatimonadaceae bacterium]